MQISLGVYIIIALLLAVVAYLTVVYYEVGKDQAITEARHIAFKLMLLAEKKFGTNNGSVKMDWVASAIIPLLPSKVLQAIIDREGLTAFLESTYRLARDFMDDGELNDSLH